MSQDQAIFPKMLAVALIVLNEDNDVLLRLRTKEPDINTWEIIAGYVNPDETLIQTATRLLRDKVGITQTLSVEFTGKYYDDPNRHPNQRCISLLFKVLTPNTNLKKVKNAAWFNKEDMQNISFALDNKKMIEDLRLL